MAADDYVHLRVLLVFALLSQFRWSKIFFTSVVIIGKKRGSLHHRCSIKKVFLEISQNSEESTCARVAFLMKLQANKETLTQVFSCEFAKFQRTTFVTEHRSRLLLKIDIKQVYVQLHFLTIPVNQKMLHLAKEL